MRKHDSFEDDGRTIADMSGIGPTPTLLPHSRKPAAAPEPVNDRPWEQPDEWTAKEKFWAVMGALKATLLIAGAYLVGLAVLLALVAMMVTLESTVLPFIFLASIGFAVIYNFGSNIFLGEISYITKAIAAVLQYCRTFQSELTPKS